MNIIRNITQYSKSNEPNQTNIVIRPITVRFWLLIINNNWILLLMNDYILLHTFKWNFNNFVYN